MWKKSERYDYFAQQTRLGRRKFISSGTTCVLFVIIWPGWVWWDAGGPSWRGPPSWLSCLHRSLSTGILSRTWIVWTLMPMPRCSLRQGCPWVSQHEVGLWVRTGNPRPSAVSSQVSSGPTWSCPQMANPICPVAGRGQKHVHTGHMNKDGCCSWEACFLEEASFQWSLCHAYGFEGPFPVSPFPAEP